MTDLPEISAALPPAGWYPDHTAAPRVRWWNGSAWTDDTRPSLGESLAEATPYTLHQTAKAVPAGTPVYTPFIWIMTLLPLVSIATLLTIDASALVVSSTDPLAMYRDPGYLTSLALGWIVYGASVLLAYLDHKRLLRDGFDRPFHWAWTFFAGGVYVIGRSIIVRRRSGRGQAPIWVWASITLFAMIVGIVEVGRIMATLMSTIPFSG